MKTLEEIEGVILDKMSHMEGWSPSADHVAHAMGLCKHFADTQVYFPKNTQTLHRKRDQALQADYARGIPISQLSLKYGLSQGRIYRILKQTDPLLKD